MVNYTQSTSSQEMAPLFATLRLLRRLGYPRRQGILTTSVPLAYRPVERLLLC